MKFVNILKVFKTAKKNVIYLYDIFKKEKLNSVNPVMMENKVVGKLYTMKSGINRGKMNNFDIWQKNSNFFENCTELIFNSLSKDETLSSVIIRTKNGTNDNL